MADSRSFGVKPTDFQALRNAFREFEKASTRARNAAGRVEQRQADIDAMMERGLTREADILATANLIMRKHNARNVESIASQIAGKAYEIITAPTVESLFSEES
jgi:hypothetical protein